MSIDMNKLVQASRVFDAELGMLHLVGLKTKDSRMLTSAETVQDWLHAAKPAQGWCARRSGVVVLGEASSDDAELGPIIDAEACCDDGSSLQVRFLGGDRWHVRRTCEAETGETCIAEDIALLADLDAEVATKLHYRRYWCVDTDGDSRIRLTAFVGFGRDWENGS